MRPISCLRGYGVGVALALGAGFSSVHVQAETVSALLGQWVNVEVNEPPDSLPPCRYIEAITRTYNLGRASNGGVQGVYSRLLERRWLDTLANDCKLPGTHAQPHYFQRTDVWRVLGEPSGTDTTDLTGKITDRCFGDCRDQLEPLDAFHTRLKLEKASLYDLSNSQVELRVFGGFGEKQQNEHNSGTSFRRLLQPLLDGNCREFFRASLDAATQGRTPEEGFCQIGKQLSELMPMVMRDELRFSYQVNSGALRPPGAPALLYLLEGDVLVQRIFFFDDSRRGIPVNAVLRMQPDFGWKIVALAP